MTPWEADAAAAGEWCGEAYEERRVVTFSFMKQTIGQTKVEVTHTQRRRREGDDRRVVQIRMEMKGAWRVRSDKAREALCVHVVHVNMHIFTYLCLTACTNTYICAKKYVFMFVLCKISYLSRCSRDAAIPCLYFLLLFIDEGFSHRRPLARSQASPMPTASSSTSDTWPPASATATCRSRSACTCNFSRAACSRARSG